LKLISPPLTGFPNLYHYQRFNVEWLRQAIVDKCLYFSNPASFNDPWDCQPHFNSDAAFDPALREKHVQYYIRITRKHGVNGMPLPEEEIQRTAQRLRDEPNYQGKDRRVLGRLSETDRSMLEGLLREYAPR